MGVFVCVYVRVYVCMYGWMDRCASILYGSERDAGVLMCVFVCVCMCVCIYESMYVCMYVFMDARLSCAAANEM